MSKIFFSYSRKDSGFVDQLIEKLESYGVDVWVDRGDILAGIATWRQQIVEAIIDCQVFVIVLSPNSITSDNVAKELTLAEQHSKKVLPLVIQEVNIPPSLDYQLAGLHYQTFAEGSYEDNFERLTRSLVAMGVESAKQLQKNLSEEPTIPPGKPPTDAQDQKAHDKADIDVEGDIEPDAAQKTEADKKATLMSIPAKPAEEEPAALRTVQRKISRRTIVIGVIASLLALTGIIVVAVFLTKDQPSSITSVGMVNIPAGNLHSDCLSH